MSVEKTVIIKEFDIDSVVTGSIIFCIGKRKSGKSYLVRDLMHSLNKKGFPAGQIYSGSEDWDPYFSKFFPKIFIKDDMRPGEIEDIMLRQKNKVKKRAKVLGEQHGKSKENNFFLLLDDMQSKNHVWKNSPAFKQVFTMGRHANITLIMALQFVLACSPELRQNVDYSFLFATDGNDLKKVYDNFASVVPDFKTFCDLFEKCTRNNSCMVIDKNKPRGDWNEHVFYYRAKDPGPYKFGSPAMWKFHETHYVSENEDEKEDRLLKTVGLYGKKGITVTFKS